MYIYINIYNIDKTTASQLDFLLNYIYIYMCVCVDLKMIFIPMTSEGIINEPVINSFMGGGGNLK